MLQFMSGEDEPRASGNRAGTTKRQLEEGREGEEPGQFDDEEEPGQFDDEEEPGQFDDEEESGEFDDEEELSARELARRMYKAQPLGGRIRTAGATAFTILFLSMMLIRGVHERYRERLWPLIGWYTDGLGMARTWGMFAHPRTELPIFIYGVTRDRKEVQLSPPVEDSLWVRIRDQRMRKIRAHMGNDDTRQRWGPDLVRYMCREHSTPERELIAIRLKRINRMNEGEGKTLMRRRCLK